MIYFLADFFSNSQTNLKDPDAVWDFCSLHPESIHQFSFLFSDRGTPKGYRHMNGFSSHTYKFVNAKGEGHWVKLHYHTQAGIQNLMADEANRLEGTDPDFATRDLFDHIHSGKEAVWEVSAQFIPIEEGYKYKYNIFDLTKVISQKDYPRVPFGRLVLNRNPQNYFAEVECVSKSRNRKKMEFRHPVHPFSHDYFSCDVPFFSLRSRLLTLFRESSPLRTA
jgi:catalase